MTTLVEVECRGINNSLLRQMQNTNKQLTKQTMKKLIVIVVAAVAATIVSASAADVKETWDKNCAKCHGPDGKGDTKMGKKLDIKDLTDGKVQTSLKDEDMFKAIKEGVKDGEKTKMKAAEGLSDDEIKGMVKYVRALKK